MENFALAAAELHITPSAISHQVRGLETYFCRPLFVRHNRRVELTEDGRRLLTRLTAAFDAIEAACADLMPRSAAETLSVHSSPSFASKWLGPRLPDFMRLHPGINIRMVAVADNVDLLRHEELDVVIAYGAARRQPGILCAGLGVERVAALCAPALAGLEPHDKALPLIESAVSPVRWLDWFELNGLGSIPRRAMPSFDRGALAVAAAVQGGGIALESTRFAEAELAQGSLVEFGGKSLRAIDRTLHFLCCRAVDKDLAKVSKFRAWIIAQSA